MLTDNSSVIKSTKEFFVAVKATGIIIRIDNFGKVVIPKEIRRTMRIHEGEGLFVGTVCQLKVYVEKPSQTPKFSRSINLAHILGLSLLFECFALKRRGKKIKLNASAINQTSSLSVGRGFTPAVNDNL